MSTRQELNWINVAFFTFSPLVACLGVGLYLTYQGLHWADVGSFGVMLCLTGLAINAGYHQYYSHRSYECHPLVQLFHLLFGAAAFQNSALIWAANHRSHHRFVDQERDPYNIKNGFFWAHMGWTLFKHPMELKERLANAPDLVADRLVMWQHRYYLPLTLGVGFLFPLLLGLTYERPWGGLLWGGLLRMVVFHHITFSVNSFGHSFGSQSYSEQNSSRDNWWLAFLMFGGGYHNFHHTFPGDYRGGNAWYHWDPVKWWIYSLSRVGLTWHLHRTPKAVLLKARLNTKRARSRSSKDKNKKEETPYASTASV